MIGGEDFVYETDRPAEAFEIAVRIASMNWPQAILVDARSGNVVSNRLYSVEQPPLAEALVFKDKTAQKSWLEEGATNRHAHDMRHILRGGSSVTIVLQDSRAAASASYLKAVINALKQPVFHLRAMAA